MPYVSCARLWPQLSQGNRYLGTTFEGREVAVHSSAVWHPGFPLCPQDPSFSNPNHHANQLATGTLQQMSATPDSLACSPTFVLGS